MAEDLRGGYDLTAGVSPASGEKLQRGYGLMTGVSPASGRRPQTGYGLTAREVLPQAKD